jgi:CHRD domain
MRAMRFVVGCAVAVGMATIPLGTAVADRLPGSDHGGFPESTTLLGANQVPPVTTPGSGTAEITINLGHDELCYHVTVSGLTTPVLASHIHHGTAGTNGPVVIPFPNAAGSNNFAGCVTVDDTLLNQVRSDPSDFYVNVHTTKNPGGEVRGQLGAGT